MALRALIFDIDGILADTERDGHRMAFNAAFAEAGLAWCWDETLYGELLRVAGGVERMLHYARANAIALLQTTLGAEAADAFEVIATAREVANKKPDAAVYDWVLEHLRLPPEAALASGDSRNGLIGAARAGIACIVTPTPYSAAEEFGEAVMRLTDFDRHPEESTRPVSVNDLRYWHARAVSVA